MKRDCICTSAGVFEEEHGSERRGRAHHVPPDQGLVLPSQPHGTRMGNLMEEVVDAVKLLVVSTSKSHLQESHAELRGLCCVSVLVPSHQQLHCLQYRSCVMYNVGQ